MSTRIYGASDGEKMTRVQLLNEIARLRAKLEVELHAHQDTEIERAAWRAEALAARELLGLPGLELMWDAKDLDGWTRKRALYASARAANGEDK